MNYRGRGKTEDGKAKRWKQNDIRIIEQKITNILGLKKPKNIFHFVCNFANELKPCILPLDCYLPSNMSMWTLSSFLLPE